MTATRQSAQRRARRGSIPFLYRCPPRLMARLIEGRFRLRAASRTALVTAAIEAYLDARGIEAGDAERTIR